MIDSWARGMSCAAMAAVISTAPNDRMAQRPRRTNGALIGLMMAFSAFAVTGLAATGHAETVRLGASTPTVTRGHPFTAYLGGGVKSSVYDGLTQISQAGELQPGLALTWKMMSPTRWRFQLRPGVTFQNGRPFDADTVVANVRYLKSAPAQVFTAAQDLSIVADVSLIDSMSVEFETIAPDPVFPRRLSFVSMVEPEAWARLGPDGYAEAPIGTGPYRVIAWGPAASHIVLEAFEGSWRKIKSVTRIEMVVIPDTTARFNALVSGSIDLAVALDPDMIDGARQAGLKALLRPRPIVLAIAFRNLGNDNSPLLDRRVRQALNHAVNKQTIVDQILYGTMGIASQAATATVVGYNAAISPYAYDPGKAKDLLREAGYADGFPMTIAVFAGQVPADTLIFQRVSQDLAAVGVKVQLRILPFPEFSRRRAARDWSGLDGFSTVWSNLNLFDVMPNLDRLTCRQTSDVFCAPDLAVRIDAARVELDEAKRTLLLQDLMTEVHDLAPSLLLIENADIVGTRAGVESYRSRNDGILFDQMVLAPP
jgi:peptide/nickel transport system substrate-binding protein